MNQAAHFEPACKIFTVLIMIGQSTYDMAKDKIEVRKLGLLVAKGKKQAVGVYELLAKKGELDETMARLVAKFEQCEHFAENPPAGGLGWRVDSVDQVADALPH